MGTSAIVDTVSSTMISRAVSDEEDEDSECDANSFVLKISFVLR